jgi:hypothetical protein
VCKFATLQSRKIRIKDAQYTIQYPTRQSVLNEHGTNR